MSLTDWAELEIQAACKRENPNWDGKSFDYGCSCYQSALKAYKSLLNDEHSGYSFSVTRNILERLLHQIPLSPIIDEDFFSVERGTEKYPAESPEYLKERGLKSDLQCPRRSSLFREETLDGKVSYHDLDRSYCVNAECPSDTFHSGCDKFLDELYPITMPYSPRKEAFVVYTRTWLTDKAHGDFDVHEIIGYEDQDGVWHDYNRFEYYGDEDTKIIEDSETIENLRRARISSLEGDIAAHLRMDIVDTYATDEMWDKRKEDDTYENTKQICNTYLDSIFDDLKEYCKCLTKENEHGVCYLNTWANQRAIVKGNKEAIKDIIEEYPEVEDLVDYIADIKKNIEEQL